MQYLACGLPVVSTRLAGLEGLVTDGQGIVYQNLDEGLTESVSHLLIDETARYQQVDRARGSVAEKCNWDICLPQFTDLLEKIIKNR